MSISFTCIPMYNYFHGPSDVSDLNPYPGGRPAYASYLNDKPNEPQRKIEIYAEALQREIDLAIANRRAGDFLAKFLQDPLKYLVFVEDKGFSVEVLFPPHLQECPCMTGTFNRFKNDRRSNLEDQLLRELIATHPKSEPLRYLSLGSGNCLQDFINIGKMIVNGYEQIDAILVDCQYEIESKSARESAYTLEHIRNLQQQMRLLFAVAEEKGFRLNISFLSSVTQAEGAFQVIQAIDFEGIEMHYPLYAERCFRDLEIANSLLAENGKMHLSFSRQDLILSATDRENTRRIVHDALRSPPPTMDSKCIIA